MKHTACYAMYKRLSRMINWFIVMTILCGSFSCFANAIKEGELISNPVNLKLWNKVNSKEKSALKDGTFVGYSHSFQKYFGVDLSIDSYIYTNKSNNSLGWVVGFVSELFKLNYHIDQKEQNQYLEVKTSYPLNGAISLTGYAGNKHDGTDEYRDYSVGLAYSVNQSIEVSAGFIDRELKKSDAEGNLFFNINGTF